MANADNATDKKITLAALTDEPLKLSGHELDMLCARLHQVIKSQTAIRQLSIEAAAESGAELSWALDAKLTAIEEMARANVKGLDAVISRLGGMENGRFEAEIEA